MKYEGKTKVVEIKEKEAIISFKDDITAGDGAKHDVFAGKGNICAELTAMAMKYLNEKGVPTHFLEFVPPNVLRALPLRMFPLEVVVRFIKAGSFLRRYGGIEGEVFKEPIVEFFVKDDERHDPMVCMDHLEVLNLATREQGMKMKKIALEAGKHLKSFFEMAGFELWDIKFEFGLTTDGKVVLGDEVSPDTCRLRRKKDIYDKDVYRKDIGDPIARYKEVLEACRGIVSL